MPACCNPGEEAGEEDVDLFSALRARLKEEELRGDEQYVCDKCNCKRDAVRGVRLATLPPILSFHLARFRYRTVEPKAGFAGCFGRERDGAHPGCQERASLRGAAGHGTAAPRPWSPQEEETGRWPSGCMRTARAPATSFTDAPHTTLPRPPPCPCFFLPGDHRLVKLTTPLRFSKTLGMAEFTAPASRAAAPGPRAGGAGGAGGSEGGAEADEVGGAATLAATPADEGAAAEEDEGAAAALEYELYAVVMHVGSPSDGHYYALIQVRSSPPSA